MKHPTTAARRDITHHDAGGVAAAATGLVASNAARQPRNTLRALGSKSLGEMEGWGRVQGVACIVDAALHWAKVLTPEGRAGQGGDLRARQLRAAAVSKRE